MEQSRLLSVIIPVYRVEKYLRRCLDSIVTQCTDRSDIEIILVDDGSPDDCPQICDEYAERYPEVVKVIHKSNGGLSSARNEGLDAAAGEYVVFVDSDDHLRNDYVEVLVKALSASPQLVSFGQIIRYADTGKDVLKASPFCRAVSVQDGIRLLDNNGTFNMVTNKAYKRDVIETEPRCRFELRSDPGEDLLFNCEYFRKIDTVLGLEETLYYYMRQNEDTLANTYRPDLIEKNMKFISARTRFYDDMGLNAAGDVNLLAKGNVAYVFSAIPNMYRGGSQTFDKRKRVAYYKMILNSEDIRQWVEITESPNILISIFRVVYRFRSAHLMDVSFLFMMSMRNTFHKSWNVLRNRVT